MLQAYYYLNTLQACSNYIENLITGLSQMSHVTLTCHLPHLACSHVQGYFSNLTSSACTEWASSCIGLARRTIVSAGVLYFSSTTCKTAPQRHFAMLHQDRAREGCKWVARAVANKRDELRSHLRRLVLQRLQTLFTTRTCILGVIIFLKS